MFGLDDEEFGVAGRIGREKDGRNKTKTVGVLEKKANVTIIGGEVVIGKEAKGDLKFNMLVSYTYRSDDPAEGNGDGASASPSKTTTKQPETKTFAFYTVVDLGMIIPKEDPKTDADFER